MLEDLYKELLEKVNGGNECVMLTYLDLHSDRKGAIADKILLTGEDIKNK